jgi:hypothetical protein
MLKCEWCAGVGHFPNKKTHVGSKVKKKQKCHVCDGIGRFFPFREDDRLMFMRAVRATWQIIAADMPNADRMPLDERVDVVLDADYMRQYGSSIKKEKLRIEQIRFGRLGKSDDLSHHWAREALR